MGDKDFGYRLKLARKKEGYSLRNLSEAIGKLVSAQSLSNYERGKLLPDSTVLIALSDALKVSVDFLLAPKQITLGSIDFRKNARTLATERARVEAEVLDSVEKRLELDEILGVQPSPWDPPLEEVLTNSEQAAEVADKVRENWALGMNPIADATELLEEKGLIVLMLKLPNNVSGLTCFVNRQQGTPVPVIVVNSVHPLERRRFTLVHELGHRLFRVVDETGNLAERETEKAANVFAGSFLMHRKHFVGLVGKSRRAFSVNEILALKRVYRVSAAAFLYRMKQLGLIGQYQLEHAFKTFARGWRTEEPNELELFPGESAPKRGVLERPTLFEIKVYHALAEELISRSKASELLGRDLVEFNSGLRGLG